LEGKGEKRGEGRGLLAQLSILPITGSSGRDEEGGKLWSRHALLFRLGERNDRRGKKEERGREGEAVHHHPFSYPPSSRGEKRGRRNESRLFSSTTVTGPGKGGEKRKGKKAAWPLLSFARCWRTATKGEERIWPALPPAADKGREKRGGKEEPRSLLRRPAPWSKKGERKGGWPPLLYRLPAAGQGRRKKKGKKGGGRVVPFVHHLFRAPLSRAVQRGEGGERGLPLRPPRIPTHHQGKRGGEKKKEKGRRGKGRPSSPSPLSIEPLVTH